MGILGDLGITLVGWALILFAPLEWAFVTLVVAWLLIPGSLIVPGAPHILLVDRLLLYTFVFRLLVRAGRPGEPKGTAYRLSGMHLMLVVLLLVAYFDGVLLTSNSSFLASNLHGFLGYLDLFFLFVIVLAVIRTLGTWKVVRCIAVVLAIVALIGLIEWFTGKGWSHFVFEGVPLTDFTTAGNTLSYRGSHPRSQVAAQFALEYGWVTAMLVPLAIYAALRWGRAHPRIGLLALALPAAMVVDVVFSASRSAEVALGIAVLAYFAAAGADRQLIRFLSLAAMAVLVVFAVDPGFFTAPFNALTEPTSTRTERLPELFSYIIHRPFQGLGLNFGVVNQTSTFSAGASAPPVFGGVDNGYALIYARLGVIGLLAWLGLFATGAAKAARALRFPRGSDQRLIGAACMIGIIAAVAATAGYDLVSTPMSQWTVIVLAAIGVHVIETNLPPRVRKRQRGFRMLLPLIGVAIGFQVYATAPTASSQNFGILTISPGVSDLTPGQASVYAGSAVVNTLCAAITSPDVIIPGDKVTCVQGIGFSPEDPPALALVTVSGPTPASIHKELVKAFTPIFYYMPLAGGPTEPIQTGKPSWAVTAPLWSGVIFLFLALLLPPIPFRRRRPRPPPPGRGPGTGTSAADLATPEPDPHTTEELVSVAR